MRRRRAMFLGMLLLAAAGVLFSQRRGEDVSATGSSRGPSDGATPLAALPPESPRLEPGGGLPGVPPAPPHSAPPSSAGPVEVDPRLAGPSNTRTRGSVVDEETGHPIAGAIVSGEADVGGELDQGQPVVTDAAGEFRRGHGQPVTTDAAGRFDVEVVDDDGATLTVSAPGYRERTVLRRTRFSGPLALRRENRTRVRLVLTGAVADGDRFRVFRGDSDMSLGPPQDPVHWQFAAAPPPPEEWDSKVPEMPVVQGVIELPDAFDPGVARLFLVGTRGSAGPVWIHAPSRAGTLDVALRVLPRSRVEVVVMRGTAPVEGARVTQGSEAFGSLIGVGRTDASGTAWLSGFDVPGRAVMVGLPRARVEVPLPDGATRIEIDVAPHEAAADVLSAQLRSASEKAIIEWAPATLTTPAPGVSPNGVPLRPTEGTIRGVIGYDAWPPLELGLLTATPWPVSRSVVGSVSEPVRTGVSDPDFTVARLPPGQYLLVLRCGALVATTEGPIEVRSGETTDVGTLPLRRGAVLSGRVTDDAGARRAFTRVRVFAEGGALDLIAWTDPEGVYRVDGLAPGRYTVSVDTITSGEIHVVGTAEHRLDLRATRPR